MSKKLPVSVTKEDFNKLLQFVKNERDKHWKPRLKKYSKKGIILNQYLVAMILGFGSGMRISEIIGFKNHIPKLMPNQIENNLIKIISGKGNKDRVTLLPSKFFLLVDIKRNIFLEMLPLTVSRRAIQLYITQIGKKVLNKHITFHQLRHGFGTLLAGAGRPLHEIQMLMGHSRLDTTGLYLHANPQQAIQGASDVF